jgi:transcriptional regulator with XRE-family HTH domain
LQSRVTQVVSGIGPKVKLLRKANGYSLQALAVRADVSAATIHKIEHNGMVPTISTLLKIANALEKPISHFVEDDVDHVPTVKVAADERPSIFTSHDGIELAGVSGSYGDFLAAGAVATVVPGANSGTKPMEHAGEELLFIMSGRFEFEISGIVHELGAGDALHFRTEQPHAWRNPGTEAAVILWIALRPQQ